MTAEDRLKELYGMRIIVGDDDTPISLITAKGKDLIANLVVERITNMNKPSVTE